MSTTIDDLIKSLKENISTKLAKGDTGVAKDIRELHDLETKRAAESAAPPPDDHPPIRVKRSYTMTESAREARITNAQNSTGPTTEAGKNASKKNAWKHGAFAQSRIIGLGKPCKSTCPEFPCSLVEEGRCAPGGDCLDKEHLVEACMAIERALKNQDFDGFHDMMVMELGETLSIVRELRASILEHGPVVESARFDKDGKVIGYELKTHPSLLALPNLMKNLGISFTDFNMTPAAVARVKTDKEAAETIADIFRNASSALAAAKAKQNAGD